MAVSLEHDVFLNRKIRSEDWEGQGRSSLSEMRLVLAARDGKQAHELLEVYLWETEQLYMGYLAWIKDWVTAIGARDAEALWPYLVAAHAHLRHFDLQTLPSEIAATAS